MDEANITYDGNRVRESYDLVAKQYAAEYYHELQGKPFDCQILARLGQLVPDTERIFDLGCGPGEIADFLCRIGTLAGGVDLSHNMLKVGKDLNPAVKFVQACMMELPFADHSLAGLVSFYGIVHFTLSEVQAAFQEFFRVLKNGGYILFSFHVGHEIVSIESFLNQQGAILNFIYFDVREIVNTVKDVGFEIQELVVRDPYVGVEHPSRRAYILLRK